MSDYTIKAHYNTAKITVQKIKGHYTVLSIVDSEGCAVISLNNQKLIELKKVIDQVVELHDMVKGE